MNNQKYTVEWKQEEDFVFVESLELNGESDGTASGNAKQHYKKHRNSLKKRESYGPPCTEGLAVEEDRIAVTEQRYRNRERYQTDTHINAAD